jgi:hypothetical protein
MMPFPSRSRIVLCPSGCWIWKGARSRGGMRTRPRKNTYGHIRLGRRNYYKVHRLLFKIFRGRLRRDKVLDHKKKSCPTLCVNPWHLEPVSNGENVARANRKRKC